MAQIKKVKTAIIGCGTICKRIYAPNLANKFHIIDLVACADRIPERAAALAETYGLKVMTNEEIYNDPEIEIVVNLTCPESHYEVSKAAILAGKNVYSEKMMAVTFEEGQELYALAKEKGVQYTIAPDTFLGGSWQTARKALDDGLIGTPVAMTCCYSSNYQMDGEMSDVDADHFMFVLHPGGGIPYDFGGYYLHNIINLLGSIKRVGGFCKTMYPDRIYRNPRHPLYKEPVHIGTPTSIAGALEFENGVHGTLLITSDSAPRFVFQIMGTEGILILNDPNFFGGSVKVIRMGGDPIEPWMSNAPGTFFTQQTEFTLPITHPFREDSRGVGVADMAYAIRNGRRARAYMDLGFHAFEVIHGIWRSGDTGEIVEMTSHCDRPQPIRPLGLSGTAEEFMLDD
ncbi:Gfo/Idh/MocA family protein [Anaeromassilibacillus senegalensis]|uniref:Gfo/Idh/MocA family oxidoreductase n=1 Tax=Anaeromassilibacillus senegalensis TaxID=1673717 RepID=A0ABS9CNG4_9FIRM|nr:Gfo/Idh/MocA family oxidoreductase [Anaeromassilibacillus senegalensis]MCF2651885.1 Gfo/Idh/MocA family oxidoreductase [Anaeromassilibacillus senegalensis]